MPFHWRIELSLWREERRALRHLSSFDRRLLADMGINPDAIRVSYRAMAQPWSGRSLAFNRRD